MRVTAGSFAHSRRVAWTVIGLELAIALLAALVGAVLGGWQAAWSAFTGGLINTIASLYMLQRVFGAGPAVEPSRWFARLLVGEAVKFALAVGLFLVAILVLKAAFLPLILAYIASFAAYWIGLLRESFGPAT